MVRSGYDTRLYIFRRSFVHIPNFAYRSYRKWDNDAIGAQVLIPK